MSKFLFCLISLGLILGAMSKAPCGSSFAFAETRVFADQAVPQPTFGPSHPILGKARQVIVQMAILTVLQPSAISAQTPGDRRPPQRPPDVRSQESHRKSLKDLTKVLRNPNATTADILKIVGELSGEAGVVDVFIE